MSRSCVEEDCTPWINWSLWRDQLGCSWFMWRDQLGCCDGGLRLGSAGSCGGISWAAVMVVCDWAQLVHVEGSVGPAERFDWLCQYRD